jgi:hypothetical protein
MVMEIIVHPGVDSAFIAWRASFIDQCRGFALKRKVKRVPGSAVSPNTAGEPDARGFVEEIVASWVGFANGPDVAPGTRRPTTEWPIQKYLWSDFMVNPGDEVAATSPITKIFGTPGTERSGSTLMAPVRVVGVPSQAAIGVALTPAHQWTTDASIRFPRAATPSASISSTGVFRRTSTCKRSRAVSA